MAHSGFESAEAARAALEAALSEVVSAHPGVAEIGVAIGARPGELIVQIVFDGPNAKYLDDFADELLETAFGIVGRGATRPGLDLRESMLSAV
ncbi:hypothetical protein [Homoserinibacter sp. YIM 151385]|uniref:hypothetical protein n=1 Tax=Homoserinibacter sp. YIM 151385 TaxID=2985506 RepID=UPI0022F03A36|nr:hypothetical protein [Homoserinibacter sp. YIM 151385]WBU36894.1 hypothetical protein OF852_08095 [Homoserinibacter sp. YIM 151385]